jgi:hypothetical protein
MENFISLLPDMNILSFNCALLTTQTAPLTFAAFASFSTCTPFDHSQLDHDARPQPLSLFFPCRINNSYIVGLF